MISAKIEEEARIPKKLEYLISKNFTLVVSNLSKVEIARYMKSDWNTSKGKIEEIWQKFVESFKINYLIIEKIDFEELINVCLPIPTRKKTLVNLMHLQIAKKEDLWFLTGEKDLTKKYKSYYEKSLSYPELRKLFLS